MISGGGSVGFSVFWSRLGCLISSIQLFSRPVTTQVTGNTQTRYWRSTSLKSWWASSLPSSALPSQTRVPLCRWEVPLWKGFSVCICSPGLQCEVAAVNEPQSEWKVPLSGRLDAEVRLTTVSYRHWLWDLPCPHVPKPRGAQVVNTKWWGNCIEFTRICMKPSHCSDRL